MDENSTFINLLRTWQAEFGEQVFDEVGDGSFQTDVKNGLDSPSDTVLKKIFAFSKSYDVVKTKNAGCVELNFN